VGAIEHIQTHISHLFLTGKYAYKVKKAVNLGFLDFTSPETRLHFCRQELRLNRRLAPQIYLSVMAVIQTSSGLRLVSLEQAPPQAIVEACVQMLQMDNQRQMDRLLIKKEVQPAHIEEIALILNDFYAHAERGPHIDFYGLPPQIRINLEENFRQTQGFQNLEVSPARWQRVKQFSLGFLHRRQKLFKQRVAHGRIVDGHGDLHSGNINLPLNQKPIIFDCIEFNERFRYQDAACDLAFLAMDLDYNQRPDLSRLLVETYIQASGDKELAEVLDFYKCYRAVVRAKIHGLTFEDQDVPVSHRFTDLEAARSYFHLAAGYAGDEPAYFLICFMGMMGTGKSYLARKLAQATGWPLISSDQVRKQAAGLPPDQRRYDSWDQGLYSPEARAQTYQALAEGTELHLSQGQSVIVDASFAQDRWRRRFLDLAHRHGAHPLFVEVTASRAVVEERLKRRQAKGGSVSDGRLDLLDKQAAAWENGQWLMGNLGMSVDGGAPEEQKIKTLLHRLEEMGHGH
jgi:hypothetical protein